MRRRRRKAASAARKPQPVGGSAVGWTAVGGSPIVVAQGETLDTLSARYGVPAAALLKANGLSNGFEVKGGMRIVVPVYHADGHAVASAEPQKAKKRAADVADAGSSKAAKAKEKRKGEGPRQSRQAGRGRDARLQGRRRRRLCRTVQAVGQEAGDRQGADRQRRTRRGANKVPLTGAQADAAGVEPEFRWPARGRIIQGFKSGGNDGINISVPAGTSVRAAESGVVVYAGDGLKGYGNLILIKHPNGFVTAYGNNAELEVKRGEQVKRGQVIAKSGDTGNVNSPQLHFELRKGSTPVDPTNYLAGL